MPVPLPTSSYYSSSSSRNAAVKIHVGASSVSSSTGAVPTFKTVVSGSSVGCEASSTLAELSLLKFTKKRSRNVTALDVSGGISSPQNMHTSQSGNLDSEYVEVVEEKSRKTTYQSFSKVKRGTLWGIEETKHFYDALRQCGTDFTIMQGLFPSRSRRQMKLKFMREERLHPELIRSILTNTHSIPLDLEKFTAAFEASENHS